ncbi:MAG: DUF4433 domain-containing protein [Bacteroidales bacterium]|nr:DUF4433 domain-containing protein [Bacteroidales bacterium]
MSRVYIHRITHIENIPHILLYGITNETSRNANPNFKSIGDSTLISKRNDFILENGRQLGNYIPFYFGRRMPMLFVIQRGYNGVPITNAEDIVYCVSSVQKIIDAQLEFVFTDGHATDKLSKQYNTAYVNNIETIIDKQALDEKYWGGENNLDIKRKKQAEFLVLGDIPISAVISYYVYNKTAQQKMKSFGVDKEIIIKPEFYF